MLNLYNRTEIDIERSIFMEGYNQNRRAIVLIDQDVKKKKN